MIETSSRNGHPQPHTDPAANGQANGANLPRPGNPFARQVAELRQAFVDAVSAEDLEEIAGALARRAKQGNASAGKVLLAYVLGKPLPAVSPDDLDLDEISRRFRCPLGGEAMDQIMGRYRPDILAIFDRLMDVGQRADFKERFLMPPKRDKKGRLIVKDDGIAWPWRRFGKVPATLGDTELLNAAPSPNGVHGKVRVVRSRP